MEYRQIMDVIIGLQAGSEGKGKVAADIAFEKDIDLAISNNMPNAGHTTWLNGKKYVFSIFPSASIKDDVVIFLGNGTAISEGALEEEYDRYKELFKGRTIYAAPYIPIIEQRHIDFEKAKNRSGSTYKGCSAALSEKIQRDSNLKFLKTFRNVIVTDDFDKILESYLEKSRGALLEIAQGCALSLYSEHFPYVTSRPVSITQALTESVISDKWIRERIGIARLYPIRISNESVIGEKIFTGPFGNSKETNWVKITIASQRGWTVEMVDDYDVSEFMTDWIEQNGEITFEELNKTLGEDTTVTKKTRRVFEPDWKIVNRFAKNNGIDSIYLNHMHYLDKDLYGQKGDYLSLDFYQKRHLEGIEDLIDVPITRFGTSEDTGDYVFQKKILKR